ncbi:hypothetical protein [Clostridium sardiniense]|nr:hypothetical protein [Clostridium sardiniense]MDQ0461572.1 2-keto-3-deoxy-6-phosphogluconate aldolase [Clostridium sardiniense]
MIKDIIDTLKKEKVVAVIRTKNYDEANIAIIPGVMTMSELNS